ncbi:MAG: 2-oxoacid:acceptor oxidoreductase subunit alpha, partial [Anaerolineales bacterium]|nr:2-oxoacid:acceptor oxidoreductase subunit alpha [Anaerolineales bacterium]
MAVSEVASGPAAESPAHRPPVVNAFSINVATKNGSGSQTANTALLRALFKMGIPVSGKNLFPSNIQGLPTWYTIRVSAEGFTARRPRAEIVVAMNVATAIEDYQSVEAGGAFLYADDLKMPMDRTDIAHYPMPVKALAIKLEKDAKLRTYVANMVYVGVLAHLLEIQLADLEGALLFHFKGKRKPVDSNMQMIRAAADWAKENLVKQDPFKVERLNKTDGLIMIDGNTAGALGAVYGGVTFVAWYPITPATSVADALNHYLPQLRVDPETGKNTFAVVQSEDELAALGMVLGAGWAGARAMTSTSGPGISLMAEFAGYGYYAEIPAVIWDIQRMGPSTGLPTRVSQGDLLKTYYLGHGDSKHVCLLPASPAECFEFGWKAFDLAERLQTPIFVLSDLDIGMNQWMSTPFEYPDTPEDRGKVLSAEDLDRLGGFKRYKDVDGDGIPYRTVPGTPHPLAAYFTRGTGHNEAAGYSERPEDWMKNMARLAQKHETARKITPPPLVDQVAGAEVAFIAYGSADPAVAEGRWRLENKHGLKTSYLRVRALPLADSIKDFVAAHQRVYVVELDTDAQLWQLLQLHLGPE